MIYVVFFTVSNTPGSSFSHFRSLHKFKIFRKTTKFKRYNRWGTRFILNRKKYILRKRRTMLITNFSLISFWSSIYKKQKQYNRYHQSLNILPLTLSLSNRNYFEILISRIFTNYNMGATPGSSVANYNFFNCFFISKSIALNNAIFSHRVPKYFYLLFKNSCLGFFSTANASPKHVSNLNLGVLVNKNLFYSAEFCNKTLKKNESTLILRLLLFFHKIFKIIFIKTTISISTLVSRRLIN